MLKWAMRIVAVGGALLAMAVGTAAWMHRTEGRVWRCATPTACATIMISPQDVEVGGWLRREWDLDAGRFEAWKVGRYGAMSEEWDNSGTDSWFRFELQHGDVGKEWHGLGIVRGDISSPQPRPSFMAVLCPTWAPIAVLLLPMGLWAGIGWRQRRRVRAGHCVNCGYDLRASPGRCPECGRELLKR